MAVKAVCGSSLNPHAPHFVPSYFEVVEDFSPEWWQLVKSSPAFCDYWIRERWEISPLDNNSSLGFDFDFADLSDGELEFDEEEEEEEAVDEVPEESVESPHTLKEQDLNLCESPKSRVVKLADLVNPHVPDHAPREARQKIVQVPPKLAAAQGRKASLKSRIQQPR